MHFKGALSFKLRNSASFSVFDLDGKSVFINNAVILLSNKLSGNFEKIINQ
jgi:hypothetical protein